MAIRDTLRRHLPSATFVVVTLAATTLIGAITVATGAYDVGADVPHTRPVYALLEAVRDRSIAVRASGIVTPADLMTPARVSAGAGLYAEMCSSCHLGPGLERSEISQGLYPQAPKLAEPQDMTPAEQFWIIKHGVKLSAMPAWGKTHPDPLIWDMVAFVRTMPTLNPQRYKALVASAPADHDAMMKDMADAAQVSHGH